MPKGINLVNEQPTGLYLYVGLYGPQGPQETTWSATSYLCYPDSNGYEEVLELQETWSPHTTKEAAQQEILDCKTTNFLAHRMPVWIQVVP